MTVNGEEIRDEALQRMNVQQEVEEVARLVAKRSG